MRELFRHDSVFHKAVTDGILFIFEKERVFSF